MLRCLWRNSFCFAVAWWGEGVGGVVWWCGANHTVDGDDDATTRRETSVVYMAALLLLVALSFPSI